ncbi:MAG: TonB-dependent receptor [Candidatus Omnitrophica bacterium]|nr:TonB-dependent receptor [Candidatus Omnitrophota bacterium]MDD5429084.1 TonB-dependent receptor [Candidatus Omnitrophota bacterium]
MVRKGFFLFLVFSSFRCLAQDVVELEEIVVTPQRSSIRIYDASRPVTVITAEDIESSNARSLPEAIQKKSGIAVTDYLGNPKGTVVDIRGFGESSPSNVLVLIDGRRTNQVDLSGVDWGQINPEAIERIEILRGPGSVLYGDNASAGVINIITKTPPADKLMFKAGTSIGSYQAKQSFLNIGKGFKLGELFFNYSSQETDGYRANNSYWADDYLGKASFKPNESFNLNFSSGYHRDRYGMPGALYPADIENVGRRGTVYPDDRGKTSDFFVDVTPQVSFFLGDSRAEISLPNSFRKRNSSGLNIYTPDVSEYETVHHTTTYELRPKFEVNSLWDENKNSFVSGIDYFWASDGILSGNRIGSQQDHAYIHKDTLGLYCYDSLQILDSFLVDLGGRYDWAKYTFNQTGVVGNYDTKEIRDGAGNISLGYKYNEKSQVYFSYSRSYRLPNTEEYYQNKGIFWGQEYGGLNTTLKQQQANSYELGLKHYSWDWLKVDSDIFLMDVKDEIYYDPSTYKNSNYGSDTRHYGLEVEARASAWQDKLRPFAALTLQKSYFKGGEYANKSVPFVPKVKFSLGTALSPFKDFNWNLSCTYTGSRYKISDQKNISPKLKDYVLFDTSFDYTFKKAKLWLAVKNFLNRKYYAYGVTNSSGTAETFYPASGRRFEGGVTFEF